MWGTVDARAASETAAKGSSEGSVRSVKTRLPTPAIRALQTSYDGADGLAGLAVSYLVFVGRAVVGNVDLRRADFGQQWA